jgi:hypothetical protein
LLGDVWGFHGLRLGAQRQGHHGSEQKALRKRGHGTSGRLDLKDQSEMANIGEWTNVEEDFYGNVSTAPY